ncbi:MAG: L,D-transpeptidase family protein [Bacteroidetes bacterium]|nr:L,D-transpeptidase family protein [Bacteroidota bacterium]
MRTNRFIASTLHGLLGLCIGILIACNGKGQSGTIADTPQELQQKTPGLIREFVDKLSTGNGAMEDSTVVLQQSRITAMVYGAREYVPVWSFEEKWLPAGDSLLRLLRNARQYGLFPEDYFYPILDSIRVKIAADSMGRAERKDAMVWAKADILLTNAFVQLIRDVKLGRLPSDSISLRKDTTITDEFYQQQLTALQQGQPLSRLIAALEPTHRGYQLLKEGIPAFLAKADYRPFTRVPAKDAAGYQKALQQRLYEGGYIGFKPDSLRADSVQLAQAIKKFQKEKSITVDGKAGDATIRMLNTSDREKFIRIAISMDRYKLLPEKMPSKYIWVNTSANYMEVIDNNEVKLSSRVICGKAKTRTPLLNGLINALITYPQWVPPPSIVSKEILPAVKKNPGYLAKKGFTLVDSNGEEVDPYSVDWSKYSKGIPYRVVQGSGDANALGVMKFVFDNKYSVYLHDTNQRYLFGNAMRSLSHGCVRVQSWQDLAWYLLRNDSLSAKGGNYTRTDSVKTWLARKEKKTISLRNKMPVFLRYFTCEGQNRNIIFYDDVYAEDKFLREKYFATK